MTISAGTVEALLRLRDEMSPALKTAAKSVRAFVNDAEQMKVIGTFVAGAAAAVSGLVAGFVALGARGADVADLRAQFDALNDRLGNTGDVLGRMRAAFAGTASDFDIMKSTNTAFSLGLKLTTEQLELAAKGARVLADRTGGDAKEAFDSLTRAMATGQERLLRQSGLSADVEGATRRVADAVGVETSKLTDSQRAVAMKTATLEALKKTLELTGEAEFDFGDAVSKARATWVNMMDTLALSIAQNPAVKAGVDAISKALDGAFGVSQAQKISALSKFVTDFALVLVSVGKAGIEVARFIANAWSGLNVAFTDTMNVLFSVVTGFADMVVAAGNLAAKLPLVGDRFKSLTADAREEADALRTMAQSFRDQTAETLDGAAAQNAAFDKMQGTLNDVRGAMLSAKASEEQLAEVTVDLTGDQAALTRTTEQVAEANKKAAAESEKWAKGIDAWTDAIVAADKAAMEWAQNILEQFGPTAEQMEQKVKDIEAGVKAFNGVVGMSDAQVKNLADQLKNLMDAGVEIPDGLLLPVNDRLRQMGRELPNTTEGVKKLSTSLGQNLKSALSGLPGVILGAIQGGGNALKSVGASIFGSIFSEGSSIVTGLTNKLGGLLGKGLGSAIGSVIPGLGTALGGMIGGLGSKLIGNLFGGKEKEVDKLRDAFLHIIIC